MTSEESYLVAVIGRHLWTSTVHGAGGPMRAGFRERMLNPRPGDLVLEISRLGGMMPGRFDPDSIGRLVHVEGDRWVVAPLHDPGREQGWQNAQFIALPDRHKWTD